MYIWTACDQISSFLISWQSVFRMGRQSPKSLTQLSWFISFLFVIVNSYILELNSWPWWHFIILETKRALWVALNPWGKAVPCLWNYKDLLIPVGLCLPFISLQLPWHPLSVSENTFFWHTWFCPNFFSNIGYPNFGLYLIHSNFWKPFRIRLSSLAYNNLTLLAKAYC